MRHYSPDDWSEYVADSCLVSMALAALAFMLLVLIMAAGCVTVEPRAIQVQPVTEVQVEPEAWSFRPETHLTAGPDAVHLEVAPGAAQLQVRTDPGTVDIDVSTDGLGRGLEAAGREMAETVYLIGTDLVEHADRQAEQYVIPLWVAAGALCVIAAAYVYDKLAENRRR